MDGAGAVFTDAHPSGCADVLALSDNGLDGVVASSLLRFVIFVSCEHSVRFVLAAEAPSRCDLHASGWCFGEFDLNKRVELLLKAFAVKA